MVRTTGCPLTADLDREILLADADPGVCTYKAAGNEKLAKGSQGGRRQRARDDAAAACVLAVAEGAGRFCQRRGRALRVAVVG